MRVQCTLYNTYIIILSCYEDSPCFFILYLPLSSQTFKIRRFVLGNLKIASIREAMRSKIWIWERKNGKNLIRCKISKLFLLKLQLEHQMNGEINCPRFYFVFLFVLVFKFKIPGSLMYSEFSIQQQIWSNLHGHLKRTIFFVVACSSNQVRTFVKLQFILEIILFFFQIQWIRVHSCAVFLLHMTFSWRCLTNGLKKATYFWFGISWKSFIVN